MPDGASKDSARVVGIGAESDAEGDGGVVAIGGVTVPQEASPLAFVFFELGDEACGGAAVIVPGDGEGGGREEGEGEEGGDEVSHVGVNGGVFGFIPGVANRGEVIH